MNCDKFMQLLDAYFDGELDSQTSKEFGEHRQSCNDCNLLFTSYEDMLNSLNDLRHEEIPFPEGLHENIMKSVNAVAMSTSNTDIIDITKHIENNEKPEKSEIKVVKDFRMTRESYWTKRRVNTLVAGFLTLFIGTGAYTTYDRLQNPVTTPEPLLNIDYNALESATIETEESSIPEEEIVLFNTEIAASSQEGGGTSSSEGSVGTGVASVSEDSVETPQVTTYTANATVEPSVTEGPIAPDTSVSNEVAEQEVATTEPKAAVQSSSMQVAEPQASVAAPQTRKITAPISNDVVISIKNKDSELIKTYLDYLKACPDITVGDEVVNVGNEYQLTATSSNFENFMFYAKNFSGYDKETLDFSYSDETLAKIKELQEFKIRLVQN